MCSVARATTAENKLNALLGLTEKVQEVKTRSTGRIVGVTEKEIQEFREAQGLIYFLQAPALFTPKTCGHCGEAFLVSRKYVAYCSYTCIQKSLEEKGVGWRKGRDLEALAQDPQVYDGNEPLWIRSHSLKRAHEILTSLLEKDSDTEFVLKSSTVTPVPEESPTTSKTTLPEPSSSPPTTTTQSNDTTVIKKSSTKKKPKRQITFGG